MKYSTGKDCTVCSGTEVCNHSKQINSWGFSLVQPVEILAERQTAEGDYSSPLFTQPSTTFHALPVVTEGGGGRENSCEFCVPSPSTIIERRIV